MKTKLLNLIILALLSFPSLSQYAVRTMDDGKYACPGDNPDHTLSLGITRYYARDEVKFKAELGKNIVFKSCAGRSIVIKTDNVIVPPILPPMCVGCNGEDRYTERNTATTYSVTAENNPVGFTPGHADISPTGAATYSIPLDLPDAVGGLKPDLSIVYNSQGGNGALGQGFDLQGISTIYRVPNNRYFETYSHSIDLSSEDNFSIDGNRLIPYNDASLEKGWYFKPANETFWLYQAYFTSPNFKWFIAKNQNGEQLQFGDKNGNGLTIPNNSTVPLMYHITNYSDANGNSIDYQYYNYYGMALISRIIYNSNTSPHPYEIAFKYADKIDKSAFNIKYENGKIVNFSQAVLLKEVAIFSKGVEVKKYTFDYEYENSASKLNTITEYAKSKKLNSTKIKWYDSAEMITQSFFGTNIVFTDPQYPKYGTNVNKVLSGDFNGDGFKDLVIHRTYEFPKRSGYYALEFFLSQGVNGGFTKVHDETYLGSYNEYHVMDYDNDGQDEIVQATNGLFLVNNLWYDSTGRYGGGYMLSQKDKIEFPDEIGLKWIDSKIGDFDGDGKSDIIIFRENHEIAYSSVPMSTVTTLNSPDVVISADVDGDGRTELITLSNCDKNNCGNNKIYSLNESGGLFYERKSNIGALSNNENVIPIYGDFNGDGKQDILGLFKLTPNANYNLVINQSNGIDYDLINPDGLIELVNSKSFSSSNEFGKTFKVFTGNFNGDSKSDILCIENLGESIIVKIAISNGNSFSILTKSFATYNGGFKYINAAIDDFNGDSFDDLFFIDKKGTPQYFNINKYIFTGHPLLIENIFDGYGNQTHLRYAPISPSIDYAYKPRYNSVNFPLQNIHSGIWAVTQLSVSDGSGKLKDFNYFYEGGILHRQGFGFLGFQKVRQTDVAGKAFTETYYNVDKNLYRPYLDSTVSYTTETGNDVKLTSVLYFNNFHSLGSKRYFSFQDSIITHVKLTGTTSVESVVYNLSKINDKSYGELLKTKVKSINASSQLEGYEETIYGYNVYYGIGLKLRRPAYEITNKYIKGNDNIYTNKTSYESADAYDRITGNLLKATYNSGNSKNEIVKTFTYNGFGQVLTATTTPKGEEQSKITYTYNSDGRFLTALQQNQEPSSSYEYDLVNGNILKETTPGGLVQTYDKYDPMNRLIQGTDPLGNSIKYTYEWVGSGNTIYKVKKEASAAPTATAYYDSYERMVKGETDAFGSKTLVETINYDNRGRIFSKISPHFSNETENDFKTSYIYEFDGTKFKTKTTTRTKTYTEEQEGLTTKTTDAGQRKSQSTVNALGLVTSSTNYLSQTVTYDKYHSSGQIQEITANGQKSIFLYDNLGRDSLTTDPTSGKSTFTYNSLDAPLTTEDAGTNKSVAEYDALRRLTKKTIGTDVVNFAFYTSGTAERGQIKEAYFDGIVPQKMAYAYDSKGRISKTTQDIEAATKKFSLETKTEYSSSGDISKKTLASGFAVNYEYDYIGNLVRIKRADNGALIWELLDVKSNGQPLQVKFGNNAITNFAYDTYDFQTSHTVTLSNNDVYSYLTAFNANTGNLEWRTNFDKTTNRRYEYFQYDDADRLTGISPLYTNANASPTYSKAITYKDNGNIDTKFDVGTYTYSTDKPYILSSLVTNEESIVPLETQTVKYTAFQKVSEINENSKKATFIYGRGQDRIAMTVGTKTIIYGEDYEAELDASGNIVKEWTYIFGPDGLVAVFINDSEGKKLYYSHTDHLGSVLLLSNDANEIWKFNFDAWGNRRHPYNFGALTQTDRNNLKLRRGFTFHEHLDDFALINMNGRVYDPLLGRMLNPDAVVPDATDAQTYNAYSYVMNNPLKYTDPDGDCPICIVLVVAAVVGGTLNVVDAAMSGKVHNFGEGLAYFGAGAIGGVVAVYNPSAGFATTAALNIGTDFVSGNAYKEYGKSSSGINPWTIGFSALGGLNAVAGGQAGRNVGEAIRASRAKGSLLILEGFSNAGKITAPEVIEDIGKVGVNETGKRLTSNEIGKVGQSIIEGEGAIKGTFRLANKELRYVDGLYKGVAIEAKTGKVGLTKFIKNQIAKDIELRATGRVDNILWRFFKSPITGKGGPTKPLKEYLIKHGIPYVIH